MVSVRLPDWLEEDLEEFTYINRKTKSDVIIESLIFYLYSFLGFHKPYFVKLSSELEKKEKFLIFKVDIKGKRKDLKILQKNNKLYIFCREGKNLYYALIKLPFIDKKIKYKFKGKKLLIILSMPKARRVNVC